MKDLVLSPVTMTSLELVDFINSQRKDGESELRHDHFMAKVPKVLGELAVPNFRDSYIGKDGTTRPCYRFPKREACLMAMSYSYELQAKVFDRMTELEAQQKPVIALPSNYKEALLALVAAEEEKERIALERDHAIATKAQIGSKREASAMAKASQAVKKVNALQAELGRCKTHATIIAVQNITGQEYKWQSLKKWCKQYGVKAVEVVDPRWGVVKSWPAKAWQDVYNVDIDNLFNLSQYDKDNISK